MTLILPMIGSGYIAAGGVTLSQPDTNLAANVIYNQTVYTFDITAGVGGLVGVTLDGRAVSAANPTEVSSVTIDGITATLVQPYGTAGRLYGAIAYTTGVSSGTVEVVVTLTEAANHCIWNPFTITDFTSSTHNDSFHVSKLTGSVTLLSSTLDVLAGGCVVAMAAGNYNERGDTIAFTGVDLIDNQRVRLTAHVLAVGGIDGLAAETGRTISADFTPVMFNAADENLYLTAVTWS